MTEGKHDTQHESHPPKPVYKRWFRSVKGSIRGLRPASPGRSPLPSPELHEHDTPHDVSTHGQLLVPSPSTKARRLAPLDIPPTIYVCTPTPKPVCDEDDDEYYGPPKPVPPPSPGRLSVDVKRL